MVISPYKASSLHIYILRLLCSSFLSVFASYGYHRIFSLPLFLLFSYIYHLLTWSFFIISHISLYYCSISTSLQFPFTSQPLSDYSSLSIFPTWVIYIDLFLLHNLPLSSRVLTFPIYARMGDSTKHSDDPPASSPTPEAADQPKLKRMNRQLIIPDEYTQGWDTRDAFRELYQNW